jgi:hypothetical protein
LADAMLDNAALKDLLAKNSDARCQARSCRLPAFYCIAKSGSVPARFKREAGVSEQRPKWGARTPQLDTVPNPSLQESEIIVQWYQCQS